MLPDVLRALMKQDLKEAFIDMGVVHAISDWLSPLPDKSMPHLSIRTEMLKILHSLPSVSSETLKISKIGVQVMRMYKNPKETRENKVSAGKLINKWSRPLFGLNDNFKSISREEREQRDLEQMPQSKRRKFTTEKDKDGEPDQQEERERGASRPGDKDFIMRARVPMPSNKDYVVRPQWKVDQSEDGDSGFRKANKSKQTKDPRLDKHVKAFADKKKRMKMQRAVTISLEGNKMKLI